MSTQPTASLDVTFEIFPVATDLAAESLRKTVATLAPMRPRFFSVTSGADGAARDLTTKTLATIKGHHTDLPLAGHLTCVGGTREEKLSCAKAYEQSGARWAVALRGDPATGVGTQFVPTPGGYPGAPELIKDLRAETKLRIAIGGYPEPHPESRGKQSDLDHLKRKVDAGADMILTQFFFENDVFYRYVEDCRKAGINIPIVPGIMPIANFAKIASFAKRCGASVPERLAERFEKAEDRGVAKELAMAVCAGQCDELRAQGVKQLHFYTLNQAGLSLAVCQALGLDPSKPVDGGGVEAHPEALSA